MMSVTFGKYMSLKSQANIIIELEFDGDFSKKNSYPAVYIK